MKSIYFIVIISILLSSCFKEDDPMPPFPKKESIVALNQYYQFQAYFDLGTGEVVSSNDRNLWDIGFESAPDSYHIILNSSAFMKAANTGITDFESVNETIGLEWKYDKSDGNPDSMAFNNWISITGIDTIYSNYVYVINRGFTHLGIPRGLKKIAILNVNSEEYTIKYADLNGNNYHEFIIEKDPEVNYTFFSFKGEGTQLTLEPPSDSWDLFFTQYTTLLFTDEGKPEPYLLNGVLTNYGRVEITLDTITAFESIDLNYAQTLEYSMDKDAIGWDWKYLDGDPTGGGTPTYLVKPNDKYPNWTYIIKNRNGVYFKLMFTRFYNDVDGEKGYPTFAYIPL